MDKVAKWGLILTATGTIFGVLSFFRDVSDFKIDTSTATEFEPSKKFDENIKNIDAVYTDEIDSEKDRTNSIHRNKLITVNNIDRLKEMKLNYQKYFKNNKMPLSENSNLAFTEDGNLCFFQKSDKIFNNWVDSSFVVPIADIDRFEVSTFFLSNFHIIFKENSSSEINKGFLIVTASKNFNLPLFNKYVEYGLKRYNSDIKVTKDSTENAAFVGFILLSILVFWFFWKNYKTSA